MFLNRDFNQLR